MRAFVGTMQREAFELPQWDDETAPEHELSPAASGRLAELRCPVLVVVGDADQPAVIETAERIAAEAPRANLIVWRDVAHMLPLERTVEFAGLAEGFLRELEAARR
jgi:pimeloyl-ACP methyl ester carboxylesterase